MTSSRKRPIPGLVAFDMDGTLLQDRFVFAAAAKLHLTSELKRALVSTTTPYLRSRNVARLFKGRTLNQMADIVADMPLNPGAEKAVEQLKESGFEIGIISDSYTVATGVVARRLNLDFDVANVLEARDDVMTGRLDMPMGWERIECNCRQSVCKQYALRRITADSGASMSDTIAIGDSISDVCMVENAGIGLWFNPPGKRPQVVADSTFSIDNLLSVPKFALGMSQRPRRTTAGRYS